jgi:hypothetical protein
MIIMLPSSINTFIRNFYGYGNRAGNFWLIGMEEGGGGSEAEIAQRLQVWEALGCPETADLAEFHLRLGMPKLFQEPVALQHTWAHLIRLVLAAKGEAPDTTAVKEYQRVRLGRQKDESCLLELLPLPSPSTGIWNYGAWTGIPYLENREIYRQTCLPWRIEHLRNLLAEQFPAVVVFYGSAYRRWFEQIAGCALTGMESSGVGWADRGRTLFLLVKHPAARGVSGQYFVDAGCEIRRRLEGAAWLSG